MAQQVIKNPSITSGDFSLSGDAIIAIAGHPLAGMGGGGTKSDFVYVPAFDNATGDLTFSLNTTAIAGYGPWHVSGATGPQGEAGPQGLSGISPTVSITPIEGGNHVTFTYGTEGLTTGFDVLSGATGPQGDPGEQGEPGEQGQPGTDACPITATSTTAVGGTEVTISYTSGGNPLTQFTLLSGTSGISPIITTAAATSDIQHKNGGTVITINDNNGEHVFTAWNGNNGDAAGALPIYGGTGLDARLNGSQYNIDFSADYLAAIQSVSSKVNTNAFNEYTGTIAPNTYLTQASADTLYQAKGNYISSANFDDDKVYGYTIEGWTAIDVGHILDAGSGISLVDDTINAKIGTDLTFDDVTSAIKINTNGTANNTAINNRNFVEGSWTVANGYNCHAEGAGTSALGYGVHAQGMWTCFSSSKWGDDKHIDTDIYWAVGAGAAVEGYCNATTSCPMSGTDGKDDYGPVHGGIIKVIGNGYIEHDQQPDPDAHTHTHYPSDALILYRDGSLSAAGKISAAGIELGADPDLSDYIPYSALNLPIGSDNTATNYAASIGQRNYGDILSFALGNTNTATSTGCSIGVFNSAHNISLAFGNACTANWVGISIGYQNFAYDHSIALGNICSANQYGFAAIQKCSAYDRAFSVGQFNTAIDRSFAAGQDNKALGRSFTFGHANTASNYSYLFGRGLSYAGPTTGGSDMGAFVVGGWNKTTAYATTADAPVFIVANGTGGSRNDAFIVYRNGAIKAGNDTTANASNSVAFGSLTQASGNAAFAAGAWCYAIGQGAHAEGNSCGTTGYGNHVQGSFNVFESTGAAYNGPANTPVFVGGTLNATTAQNYSDHGGYLQVMGNGTYQSQGTGIRSDAYILYRDGTVKAKDFVAGGDTLSANYPVPKTVPNMSDSTLKIQRMFVCTSDNDIIAHVNAGLAEGEGCVFFRVGS